LGALFRDGEGWAVFAVEDGRARLRPIDVGHRGREAAEVLSGVGPGTRVVLYPSDEIRDGVRVRPES